MKILISPSKTQNEKVELKNYFLKNTNPIFEKDALHINEILSKTVKDKNFWTQLEIKDDNEKLKQQSIALIDNFNNHKAPCILKYNGLQFKNLDFLSLDETQQNNLNNNLFIMSAYYGLLKPSDLTSSYRLMMNSVFKIDDKKNLIEYWKDKINQTLINENLIIDLASNEYNQVLDTNNLNIIRVNFVEKVKDQYKSKGTSSKMCRGVMVHKLSNYQTINLDILKQIEINNFKFEESLLKQENKLINVFYVKQ